MKDRIASRKVVSKSIESKWQGVNNLTFGDGVEQNIQNVTLSSGLQSTTLGDCVHHKMESVTSDLQRITFGGSSKQNKENVTLPIGLRSFIFGDYFSQCMDNAAKQLAEHHLWGQLQPEHG